MASSGASVTAASRYSAARIRPSTKLEAVASSTAPFARSISSESGPRKPSRSASRWRANWIACGGSSDGKIEVLHSLAWLTEYLQFIAAALGAVAALSPVWTQSETSRYERGVVALFVIVATIAWWPGELAEYCVRFGRYIFPAIVLALVAAAAYFAQLWLRKRYGSSRITRDDEVTSRAILGG